MGCSNSKQKDISAVPVKATNGTTNGVRAPAPSATPASSAAKTAPAKTAPAKSDPAPAEPTPKSEPASIDAQSAPAETKPSSEEPERLPAQPEPEPEPSPEAEPVSEDPEPVPGEGEPQAATVDSVPKPEPTPEATDPNPAEPGPSAPVESDSEAAAVGEDILQPNDEIREQCQELVLSDEQLREIMRRFQDSIRRGLGRETHPASIVKCFVTYVQDLPNGTERGKFLALDLGGTNFRVLIIELGENNFFDMKSKIYAIPQDIMIGPGVQLFDHIAECLANFMKEHKMETECLPLGFTFSFPCVQKGLTKGLLVSWTKGFNCSGCVGEDVVQMLKDALARRNDVQIEVCGLLNDTTGTLMSCAWKNHNCKIGLIVGTGSNACYVEKIENAEMFDGDKSKPYVVINLEWGAFGDDGALEFVRTEYDRDIDENSLNKGKQLHEKMISGMYMGELARLALVKMTKKQLLFNGQGSDLLYERGNFFTKYVSEIESDKKGSYTNCRMVLEELGLGHATDQDCANVRYVCECVSSRAAYLSSAGVATLLNKMGEENVTVGVDGSVYRYHPHFHHLMVEKIATLAQPNIKFDLMLSEDGSGRGAALVAAVACRER